MEWFDGGKQSGYNAWLYCDAENGRVTVRSEGGYFTGGVLNNTFMYHQVTKTRRSFKRSAISTVNDIRNRNFNFSVSSWQAARIFYHPTRLCLIA